uniref:C-type lectin domain-containing protein n=1 Tax=Loa loa TaxID=7209 RepID=A0A1I7VDT2_LOALO
MAQTMVAPTAYTSMLPSFMHHHYQQKRLNSSGSNSKHIPLSDNTIAIFVLLQIVSTCSALTCMTCATSSSTHQNAIQLDKFRIIAQLPYPGCPMEPIRCDRDQDVCVTITMNIRGDGLYWIGAGCDRQEYFQHIACENVRTLTRNVQLGMAQELRVLQRVSSTLLPAFDYYDNEFLALFLIKSVLD